MRRYVTDTHAFLWHIYSPDRLGSAARAAFVATDNGHATIYIPAVVLAEVLMVVQRGRLPGVTMGHLLPHLEAIRRSSNYAMSSLSPDTILGSHTLTAIPDIFDRLIVAEAMERELPLLSRDNVITKSALVTVIWD